MGHAIFISYRRDDTEGEAGRLFDDLTRAFGDNCVFMDVAGIKPGTDFRKAIEDNVVTCGVLLAVIGPTWVTIKDAAGNPRLQDPNDFVGLEISSALKRDVPVIPVLVHDAKMPHPEAVPENLKDLCYRNSVELSHARWNSDVALLINALKAYVKSTPSTEQEPVHATVSVQLPPPHPAPPPPRKKGISPMLQGVGAAVLAVLALVIFFAVHGSKPAPGPSPEPVNPANSSPESSASTEDKATPTPADSTASTAMRPPANQSMPAAVPIPGAATNPEAPDTDTAEQAKGQGDGETGGMERLTGRWVNPTAIIGDNLAYLQLGEIGNQFAMHAWGNCKPTACDWGTEAAVFDGHGATATFVFPPNYDQTLENRVATVRAMPGLNGLDVTVHNTFTNVYGVVRTVNTRLQFVPFQQ